MWNIPSGIISTSSPSNQPYYTYIWHILADGTVFFLTDIWNAPDLHLFWHILAWEKVFFDRYLETPPLEMHLIPTIHPIGCAK